MNCSNGFAFFSDASRQEEKDAGHTHSRRLAGLPPSKPFSRRILLVLCVLPHRECCDNDSVTLCMDTERSRSLRVEIATLLIPARTRRHIARLRQHPTPEITPRRWADVLASAKFSQTICLEWKLNKRARKNLAKIFGTCIQPKSYYGCPSSTTTILSSLQISIYYEILASIFFYRAQKSHLFPPRLHFFL